MRDTDERTDEDVAKAVQEGDTEAFGILVTRYERRMLRYAMRFVFNETDAEDLVQEAFLKAYQNIRSLDVSRRFSPWMYRIAHNVFLNGIRSRKRLPLPFFDPDTLFPHPVSPDTADRTATEHEFRQMLDTCLDKLDIKYREPLTLFYFDELDYREISEVLRIPASTVGVRLKRGKEFLRKAYTELTTRDL